MGFILGLYRVRLVYIGFILGLYRASGFKVLGLGFIGFNVGLDI